MEVSGLFVREADAKFDSEQEHQVGFSPAQIEYERSCTTCDIPNEGEHDGIGLPQGGVTNLWPKKLHASNISTEAFEADADLGCKYEVEVRQKFDLEEEAHLSRPRRGKIPDFRESEVKTGRDTPLEKAVKGFAGRKTGILVNPEIGMEFDSLQEAYDFYNIYSWENGFGIRYGKSRLNVKGSKLMQEFLCGCAGKPEKENSKSIMCGCPALLRLLRTDDNGWYVADHRSNHNHEMSLTCVELRHWPSHKHIDKYTKDLICHLKGQNVDLTKIYNIIGSHFGRMENVPFTKRSLRTFCAKVSMEQADDDVKKTLSAFSEVSKDDPGFAFRVQIDSESRVRTPLWTKGMSQEHYKYFGDVITFDTTYRTNKYEMPFGMFIGVNNHFQSIILGGVLMRNEASEDFQWVFSEFISMMGGTHPQTILTDQCLAMWCKWHVRKAKQHLGIKIKKKKAFQADFFKVVHCILTVDEFENGWNMVIEKYGQKKNTFLTQVYDVRRKWANPYFHNTFCASQTTTQQSESANHVLKKHIPPGCTMHTFFKHYQKLQFEILDKESYEEKQNRLVGVRLQFNEPIEVHASKIYTRAIFKRFGIYLFPAGNYNVEVVVPGSKYTAKHRYHCERREQWTHGTYEVSVSPDHAEFNCECGLYNHTGLLCPHALQVMRHLNVQEIPEKHIMKRWTVNARDVLPERAKCQMNRRPGSLFNAAMELVRIGNLSSENYAEMMEALLELKARIHGIQRKMESVSKRPQEQQRQRRQRPVFLWRIRILLIFKHQKLHLAIHSAQLAAQLCHGRRTSTPQ